MPFQPCQNGTNWEHVTMVCCVCTDLKDSPHEACLVVDVLLTSQQTVKSCRHLVTGVFGECLQMLRGCNSSKGGANDSVDVYRGAGWLHHRCGHHSSGCHQDQADDSGLQANLLQCVRLCQQDCSPRRLCHLPTGVASMPPLPLLLLV